MLRTLKPSLEKMSFVNKDKNSYQIKEDIWSGVGKLMVFEVEMGNKLGVKKTELYLRVDSEGCLYGGMRIELAEGIDIDNVEYGVIVALKKPGLPSYVNPLMMEEPDVKRTEKKQVGNKNKLLSGNKLFEKYEVEDFLKQYLEDGFVTVEVVSNMSIRKDQVDEERTRKVKMVEDIEKVMMNGETSDFLVVCETKKFLCHKTILSARSPVFARGIAKMMEGDTGRWVVTDSTPEAVSDMLRFIYTGEIYYGNTLEMTLEMLQLTTFYQLHDLAAASRKMLLWQMTAENAVETLVNMDKYKETDEEAKQQVISFIKKNARDVVDSDDWDVFQANYGSLVKEVVRSIKQ